MKKRLTKDQIFTIPNLLSTIRILLIPLIAYLYIVPAQYVWVAVLTAVSALTDILDGRIARRFHMVSDVGKVLDPVADKLTQAALMVCIWSRYPHVLWLFVLFAVKELYMLIWGVVLFEKKDSVNYALWHGKMNTAILLTVLAALLIFPSYISQKTADILFALCTVSILFSAALYTVSFVKRLHA